MRITMKDIRAAKMCFDGTRAFFLKHGFDWTAFLKEGIEEEYLIATNDAMALKVVKVAHGREK